MIEPLERIGDLRRDPRAERFWRFCDPYIQCAEVIIGQNRAPTCKYDISMDLDEGLRLWRLYESIQNRGYRPKPGREIEVDADNWQPVEGVHRASVLFAMDLPVPAVLIRMPKPVKNEWVFEGIWKRGKTP